MERINYLAAKLMKIFWRKMWDEWVKPWWSWCQWGNLTVTAAVAPAVFRCKRMETHPLYVITFWTFFSNKTFPTDLGEKNLFFSHRQQLVWPWAAVAWQWEMLQVFCYFRTLSLAAGAALSSAWSLVLQRAARIYLTLQGTCQSPDLWGTDILMQICRFKTPRSCSASPTGRKGRGCRAVSRLEGVSLALSLTWAELWPKDSSLELQWSISWFIILTVGNNVLLWSWIS